MRDMATLWVPIALSSLVLVGCGGDGGGPSEGLTEDLGTAVSPPGETDPDVTQLAWSANGDEIFYHAPVSGLLMITKAVRVADGTVRVVDARERYRVGLIVAGDGSLYFASVSGPSGAASLERLSPDGHTVTTVTANVLIAPRVPIRPAVVLGPEDTTFAYAVTHDECRNGTQGSSCDSLFTYNFHTGAATYRTLGEPLAFSPDGASLLLYERPCIELQSPYRCQAAVLSLVTGQLQERSLALEDDNVFMARWDLAGVRLFLMRQTPDNTFGVLDPDTGTLTAGYVVRRGEVPYATSYLDWTADGLKLAVWSALPDFALLHVADLERQTTTYAAVAASAPGGAVAFSRDGSRVAYVIGSRIYMRRL
jgi:hypothetical protein